MDYQVLFNLGVCIIGGAVSWIYFSITTSIEKLDRHVRDMPHQYMLKSDFREHLERIEKALDKISEKLDAKQDRS